MPESTLAPLQDVGRSVVSWADMEVNPIEFDRAKEKASALYHAQPSVYCPYFKTNVVLNSDGFHHLQFSARRERSKGEQFVKFRLLGRALEIIRKSGTVQEYRKMLTPVGKRSKRDGALPMKEVEYWGFVAIIGDRALRVRTILRKVGTGNVTFWSVMLHSKMRDGRQRLHDEDIEDET